MQKSDARYWMEKDAESGEAHLTIKRCVMEDAGVYMCEIQASVKEGKEGCTKCQISVEGKKCFNWPRFQLANI